MINYLNYLIFIISSLIVIIFLAVLYYHFKDRLYQKAVNKRRKKWEPEFEKYLKGEKELAEIKNVFSREYIYLYDFLKKYLKSSDEKEFKKILLLIKELKMDKFYLKKLSSGRKSLKIKAVVFLGMIEERKAIPQLQKYIHKNDEFLRRASIWSAAEIGAVDLYSSILKVVLKETSMTFESLTELTIRFGRKISYSTASLIEKNLDGDVDFKKAFGAENFELLSLFIDVLGYFRFKESLDLLQRVLEENSNEEVIIHVFKSLTKIEEDINLDLEEFLTHSNWVIRSQALRYAGIIKDASDLDLIINLLSDEKWWVRYYAGLAVYKIGKEDILKNLSQKNDRAAEMSRYILAMSH